MLDIDAEQIAPATLPRAVAVNAIEDCTVDGSVHRNSTPAYSAGGSTTGTSALAPTPSSGNSANVHSDTTRCSRQCLSPSSTARDDSRAP